MIQKSLFFYFFLVLFQGHAQWDTLGVFKGVSFRAMEIDKKGNIWAGGSKGKILKSSDTGKTWLPVNHGLPDSLDFRGLAIYKNTIYAMSAGSAENQRAIVYKSSVNEIKWTPVFVENEKGAFFDAIHISKNGNIYLLGDVINNKIYLYKALKNKWKKLELNIPPLSGEASFAASNSSIISDKKNVWFCTKNRIFFSGNKGKNWQVYDTPFENQDMHGIYGLYLNTNKEIIATGGNYGSKEPALTFSNSKDNGKTWNMLLDNYRINTIQDLDILNNKLFAVGTHGTLTSIDHGKNWQEIDKQKLNVIKCFNNTCIAAGNNFILKLR